MYGPKWVFSKRLHTCKKIYNIIGRVAVGRGPWAYVMTITILESLFRRPCTHSFQVERYSVSQSFSVLSAADYHGSLPSTTVSHEMTSEPDPTANLTFDLHLSSKEKEERSKVVLPYTAVRDGGVGMASGSTGHTSGGQIYYQPDDVDDFDESDPDDDLDI